METREAESAVTFSKDSEDCQLNLPVATGMESDNDYDNENLTSNSK